MKKLLSILLIVTMLMSLVVMAVPAFAVEAVADDGTNAALEAAGYTGITSLGQMQAGGKFYLKNNLTVRGRQGLPSNVTLDGNGKTITYTGANSLFGWAENITIKNLVLEGKITSKKDSTNNGYNEGILTNGFCATQSGQKNVLENIVSNIDIEFTEGTLTYLGFLGKAQACNYEIKNVVVNGDITVGPNASVDSIGGFFGYVGPDGPGDSVKISDSEFNGNIVVNGKTTAAAGFIGKANSINVEVVDCVNNGNITANAAGSLRLGGIIASFENFNNSNAGATINGCVNNGAIASVNFGEASFIGGIAGFVTRKVNIVNCINNGAVTMKATAQNKNNGVGGIVGGVTSEDYEEGVITIDNCFNTGAVTHDASATHAGGIVGKVHAVPVLTVSNCVNTGSVSNAANAGWQGNGGIVGTIMTYNKTWHWSNVSKCDATIYNCHNRGEVTGVDAAGILSAGKELFGANIEIKIDKCVNSGAINGKWQWGGGIAGSIGANGGDTVNLKVTNCVNSGTVKGQWEVGGIVAKVGYGSGTTTIENCANKGTITCNENVADKCAGIIRQCANAVTIKNCVDTTSPAYPIAPAANGNGMKGVTAEGNKFVKTGAGHGTAVSQTEADAAYLAVENTAYSAKTSSYIFDGRQYPTSAFNGKDIYLFNDITLTGNGGNLENATLYGNNHTITLNGAPCVIWWGNNVTVQDLAIVGTITVNSAVDHVGPISLHGFSGTSLIKNVTTDVDITVNAAVNNVGGVISKNDGSITFENVASKGDIIVNATVAQGFGGVIGWPKNATFKNVVNEGNITLNANIGWGKAGGIAGDTNANSGAYSFYNVENKGDITITANCTSQYIGGIAGSLDNAKDGVTATLENVRNSGDITSATGRNLGGILGRTCDATVSMKNVENTGDITMTGNGYVGGIVGLVNRAAFTADRLANSGDVTAAINGGHNAMAGIIGGINNENGDKAVTLTNLQNTGDVTSTAADINVHVAGVVGRVYKVLNFSLTNAINTGDVSYTTPSSFGWECVGGVVGGIMTPGAAASYTIENAVNVGNVSGTLATGGILGGTKQLRADSVVTITNSKNYGDITGVSYAGGVAGFVGDHSGAFYDLTIDGAINAGTVRSTWTGACGIDQGIKTISAGGILGRYADGGASEFAEILNSINGGHVTIDAASDARGCDAWKKVGGILGDFNGEILIKGCLHDGKLSTGGEADSAYGTFPMTNAIETIYNGGDFYNRTFIGGLIKGENNIYAEGSTRQNSVKPVGNPFNGQWINVNPLSTVVDEATFRKMVADQEMPFHNPNTVRAHVDYIYDVYVEEKWTADSWQNIEDVVDEFEAAVDAIYENLRNGIFTDKQVSIDVYKERITAATGGLILATDVCRELKLAVAESRAAVAGGNYTTESWNEYQAALAEAEALIVLDSEADPAEVEAAMQRLEQAEANLVVGGSIRSAEDFAAMDGQVGTFTLEADITVSEPIENFKGMLNGNGHIIYAESALFENMEEAVVTNVVIIGGDIEADSLFGVAKGEANAILETVVILDSIEGAVYFSDVEEYVPDVEAIDNDEPAAPTSQVLFISNTVVVNDAVNGAAGLVAHADANTAVAFIDIMFMGDVNGKAALVGDSEGTVAVIGGVIYSNVTGEETAAAIAGSANLIGVMGAYFEGVLDADEVNALASEVVDTEYSEVEAYYPYAIDGDGALVEGVDIEALHSGEATYELNKFYDEVVSTFPLYPVTVGTPFVQRIGIDATPVIGDATADGSNVVIYNEETETYENVFAFGKYEDGMFPELKVPTAPAAPDYDRLNLVIEKAESVDLDNYTDETAAALEAALEAALDARLARSQADVDAAVADLISALGGLRVPVPTVTDETVDVSGLNASISAAEALKADEYTEASWATVQAVLASAKATLTAKSQALVDQAKASLDAMVAGLVKKPVETPVVIDYAALNTAISAAEALKADDYTDASWGAVQAVLTVAKAATSATTQEAVDQAEDALALAVAGLVKAPAEAPVEEKSGCGSAITGTAAVLVAVLALGAGVSFKKKED